jgi:hypothetical protein
MKITGTDILDRLEYFRDQAQIVANEFDGSLTYFASDAEKGVAHDDPKSSISQYVALQEKIAILQELQSAYNLYVKVAVGEKEISLERAIKTYGVCGFVKNKWATAAKVDTTSSMMYGRGRVKDVEMPLPAVPVKEAKDLVRAASQEAGQYKTAIRRGNARAVDLAVLIRKYGLADVGEFLFND